MGHLASSFSIVAKGPTGKIRPTKGRGDPFPFKHTEAMACKPLNSA